MAFSLFFAGCSTTGKTVAASNDLASTDIERYIVYVDELIKRRDESNGTAAFRIREFHQSIIGKNSYGGSWDYFRQDPADEDDGEWGDRILHEEAFEGIHVKEYYRDEQRVAVIIAHDRISNEVDSETRQVVVYMDGNEVVYYRKNGRIGRQIKRILRRIP